MLVSCQIILKTKSCILQRRNAGDFAEKLCWAIEHPEDAKQIGRQGEVALHAFSSEVQTKAALKMMKIPPKVKE